MDRISEIPPPILQHILCFLCQNDATRTCVLSKSWRHLWSTRPKVEFREKSFAGNRATFVSALDDTLQRYHHQNLSIQKFHMEISNSICESELLKKWIPILLTDLGVETLDITLTGNPAVPLPLTDVVFRAEFLKELYLESCRLERCNFINYGVRLKHLRNLCLFRVHLEDETLEKIMEGCPLVERLSLFWCSGLRTVNVIKGRNLKHLGCFLSCDVEVDVPVALESISITCSTIYIQTHTIKITSFNFPRLKSVYLFNARLPRGLLGIFSCNFPCLQDLELRGCHGFKQVKLSSPSIKHLLIFEMERSIKTITIDAPNILDFEYWCYFSLPSFSFTTPASKDWKSRITVPFKLRNSSNDVSAWFLKLSEILKALRDSRITLSLFNHRTAKRHIIDTTLVGFCEPVAVEHLSLKDFYSSGSFATLFNGLFRILRPRYIHINDWGSKKGSKNQLADFICNTNLKEGDFSRCYFWYSDLKNFSMEVLDKNSSLLKNFSNVVHDKNSKEWCPVDGSCLTKSQMRRKIRFRFEWREL